MYVPTSYEPPEPRRVYDNPVVRERSAWRRLFKRTPTPASVCGSGPQPARRARPALD